MRTKTLLTNNPARITMETIDISPMRIRPQALCKWAGHTWRLIGVEIDALARPTGRVILRCEDHPNWASFDDVHSGDLRVVHHTAILAV